MTLAIVLACAAIGLVSALLVAVVIAPGRTGMGAYVDGLAAGGQAEERRDPFDRELDDLLNPHDRTE